jgi:hypothetical protein
MISSSSLIYFEISIQTFSFGVLIPEVFYLISKIETNSAKVGAVQDILRRHILARFL